MVFGYLVWTRNRLLEGEKSNTSLRLGWGLGQQKVELGQTPNVLKNSGQSGGRGAHCTILVECLVENFRADAGLG